MPNNTIANIVTHKAYAWPSGNVDSSDLLQAVEDWATSIQGAVTAVLSEHALFENASVYYYDPTAIAFNLVGEAIYSFAGQRSGAPTANGVAGLGILRTTDPRVIGKSYFPGLPENSFDNTGLVSNTRLLALTTAFASIHSNLTAPNGLDLSAVVLSKVFQQFFQILTTETSAIPAYQRRRKVNRGT